MLHAMPSRYKRPLRQTCNRNCGVLRGFSSELVSIPLFFTFTLSCLDANFLVVLLQRGKVFTCFRELTFFHSFANIPMYEGTFGVHKVELVINSRENFCNGGGITDHTTSTHDFGQVSTGHYGRWLIIDATFETSRTPIHELDRTLCLDGGNSSVHVLWHNIASIHHATRHIFTMARIALYKHRSWLEYTHRDLRNRQLLMVGLLR